MDAKEFIRKIGYAEEWDNWKKEGLYRVMEEYAEYQVNEYLKRSIEEELE